MIYFNKYKSNIILNLENVSINIKNDIFYDEYDENEIIEYGDIDLIEHFLLSKKIKNNKKDQIHEYDDLKDDDMKENLYENFKKVKYLNKTFNYKYKIIRFFIFLFFYLYVSGTFNFLNYEGNPKNKFNFNILLLLFYDNDDLKNITYSY